jgi:hypothetical protein
VGVGVPDAVPSPREPSVQVGCMRLSTGAEAVDELPERLELLLERLLRTRTRGLCLRRDRSSSSTRRPFSVLPELGGFCEITL